MEKIKTPSPAAGKHYPASLAGRKMAPEGITRIMDDAAIAQRSRHTVLIVSFNHDAIRFKEDALGHFGYKVKSAANVEDALGILRGGGISIVLNESPMPDLNPISMLMGYLDQNPDAKVILVTSRNLDKWGAGVLTKSGAAAVIERPYLLSNLVSIIDHHAGITAAPAMR